MLSGTELLLPLLRAFAAATAAAAAATSSACTRSVVALKPLKDMRVESAAGGGMGS